MPCIPRSSFRMVVVVQCFVLSELVVKVLVSCVAKVNKACATGRFNSDAVLFMLCRRQKRFIQNLFHFTLA